MTLFQVTRVKTIAPVHKIELKHAKKLPINLLSVFVSYGK